VSELGDFLQRLNSELHPRRPDIIEKDFHLHRLLRSISEDEYLGGRLAFKGGTCLVKAYTGYFRFSEDIDFTWQDASIWEGRNPRQARRLCSAEVDNVLERLRRIAKGVGLTFAGDKKDRREVIIGSGGRMARFYLRYESRVMHLPAMVKVEVNFVDRTHYPFQAMEMTSLLTDHESPELEFLFREHYTAYSAPIAIDCYSPEEIFTDKCRAVMTRRVYKLRDILDIMMLEERFGCTIGGLKGPIIEKTRFMIDLYEKYREEFKVSCLPAPEDVPSRELDLLLVDPPKDLDDDIIRVHREIQAIMDEMG
jgi:hypothetical protein